MMLKPKTARRLALLAGVAVIIGGAAFGLLVVRGWKKERQLRDLRAEGLAAYERADYQATFENIGRYLRKTRGKVEDPDLLLAFARARVHIAESDGKHLLQAKQNYEQYLELRPGDTEAALELAEIYNAVKYFQEAADLSASLRPPNPADARPEHLQALRQEARALLGLNKSGEELSAVARRITELAPEDLDAHLLWVDLLTRSGRAAEARRYADDLAQARPSDPNTRIVLAVATLAEPSEAAATRSRELLCQVAGLDPRSGQRVAPAAHTDARAARRLVAAFDRFTLYDHAFAVLEDAAARFEDPDLRKTYARRLWQSGRYTDAIALLAPINPSDRAADSELIGFRALAPISAGRSEPVGPSAESLEVRQSDFVAQGWAMALRAVDPQHPLPPVEVVDRLSNAIVKHPYEPTFAFLLGDALIRVGREEDARDRWREAIRMPQAVGWAAPSIRIAESLLEANRPDEACRAATDALRIAPSRLDTNVVWLEAQAARLQRGSTDAPDARLVLRQLESVTSAIALEGLDHRPQSLVERLLPPRVILTARAEGRDAARDELRSLLAETPAPSERILQQLAAISRQESLGLEEQCLALARETHGDTLMSALNEAVGIARNGSPAAGLARITAAAAAPGVDPVRGRLAVLRYMDAAGDADTPRAWAEFADANPDHLGVQRAVLDSPSAARDRALVDRAIERFRRLSGHGDGPEPRAVLIARARSLIETAQSAQDRDEAVMILTNLVSQRPSLLEAHMLLSRANRLSDPSKGITPDYVAALAAARQAAALAPRSTAVALEMADILLATQDLAGARATLVRIAADPASSPAERAIVAERLFAQGDAQAAVDALQSAVDATGARDPAVLETLAAARLRWGELLLRDGDAPAAKAELIAATAVFEQTLDLNPGNLRALNGSLRAAGLSGDDGVAIKACDRALASNLLAPDMVRVVQNNLAYSLLQRNADPADLARALELAKLFTAHSDVPAAFWDTRARIEEALETPDDAARSFRRALEIDPACAPAIVGLARVLSNAPDAAARDEARSLLQHLDRAGLDARLMAELAHVETALR